MKNIILYFILALFVGCVALAENENISFTDEEIQEKIDDIEPKNYRHLSHWPVIDYCLKESKIEFLKQYMVSKSFNCRVGMIHKINDKYDEIDVGNEVINSLLLYALETDNIWVRLDVGRHGDLAQRGYEDLFLASVKKQFPKINLTDLNEHEQRKHAVKYIREAMNGGHPNEKKNSPQIIKRTRPELENYTQPQNRSNREKREADMEQESQSSSQKPWIYLTILALALLSGLAYWKMRKS